MMKFLHSESCLPYYGDGIFSEIEIKLKAMKLNYFAKSIKIIFSVFMIFSALGELTMNEVVVDSMLKLGMPDYLLYLLGVLKLLGVIAIWAAPVKRLKEWAYAGFSFDLIGAIYSFIISEVIIYPDIVMAPIGLVLCLLAYFLNEK